MDPNPYAEQRYRDGLDCAQKATLYDQQEHFSAALTFYSEAVEALTQACQLAPLFNPIMSRVDDYGRRAEEIRKYLAQRQGSQTKRVSESTPKDKHNMRQLEYLLEVALMDDEKERYAEAERIYSSAVELAIRMQKQLSSDTDRARVKLLATQALERMEELKKAKKELSKGIGDIPTPPSTIPGSSSSTSAIRKQQQQHRFPRGPLTSFRDADADLSKPPKYEGYGSSTSSKSRPSSTGEGKSPTSSLVTGGGGGTKGQGGDRYSEKEIKILKANTKINGIEYLPWKNTDVAELRTVSSLPMDFVDPDGLLKLADKQRVELKGWMRPAELCENPRMAHLISSLSIKQTIIGDCSFLSSLTVCADYERKFKTRLLSRIIYPQNRHGEPILNPNGKYLVSLNLNGCKRKVVIDDRLPVGRYNQLLCSHSNSDDEFWVSLLEKAYLKVMGGYDFPGSSSNIDLHALTGWIPERTDVKDKDIDTAKLFKMMENSLRKGSALITVATGPLSDAEAERIGLVSTHAYAILNIVEIKGHRLLQIKNPWSHRRWKGNFSEHDTTHWTPELRRALNFDQMQALQVDNGVFWMDWKSLCKFFDVVYINWKPDLFQFKYTSHDYWKPSEVEKDLYNISNNPQYTLQVRNPDKAATVWLLLSRHITTKSDFANNEKFITLHVAKSNGRRLYLHADSYAHRGVKINTPHYLAKLEFLPSGTSTFTVIVSQLESLSTIYYTIRVYSTCVVSFAPVPHIYHHCQELRSDWVVGGPRPKFKLTTTAASSRVMVQLKGPKKFFVWMDLTSGSFHKDPGPARPGFNVLEVSDVPAGEYIVSASTYQAVDRKAPFFISAFSDSVIVFEPL